jgi:hypothetical protein
MPDIFCSSCSPVPIYDGRCKAGDSDGFSFTESNFNNLLSLPLYKKGSRDLPANAVVAVGYTLSTYIGKQTGSPILSSNIQFVILLGMTAALPI